MESTFTFYYCKDCGMLLFKWNKRVSRHGLSYREFSVKGFEEETDFDERETEAVKKVIQSGWIIQGKRTEEFEGTKTKFVPAP